LSLSSYAQTITNIITTNAIACNGGQASINVTTNASSNFDYLLQSQLPNGTWTNAGVITTITFPQISFPITSLSAGTYRIILYDIFSVATDTSDYMINQPLPISLFASLNNSLTCFGANDGSIELIAGGGTPPLNYSWSNGLPNNSFVNGLAAGTYTCSIIDANGCAFSGNVISVPITQPTVLTVSTSNTSVSCSGGNDGSASVNPAGGTPGYSYSWSNGQTTQTATGLSTGNYNCTITDINGCTINSGNIFISQPSALTISSSNTAASCSGGNDGTASVNPNGGTPGYSYFWSNGQTTQTATGLSTGNYNCTITDANGCTINSGNILLVNHQL